MTTIALMWEARAVAGRGQDLLAWVRGQSLDPSPARRETFAADPDRVLVITWWPVSDGSGAAAGLSGLPELPDPPADLLHRPVHRWRFTRVAET